ncbi:MAG TPA: peptide chain release factor-like protein [Nitrospirales bacterium]|nr:peptide chain release factor-like protein [Nitrospirales bacterium]
MPSPPPYRTSRAALERDVVIERYRTGGPGGQHRNVTDSAIRLTHLPSGVRVTAVDSRSQARNREIAFERLLERLTALNRVVPPRVATKPTRRAKERRLAQKRQRRTALNRRGRVGEDE